MGLFDKFKNNKKLSWEEEQLKNVSIQRAVPTRIYKEPWTVLEIQHGTTNDTKIWLKKSKLSYISDVYTDGPTNAWFFDMIVDGQKIIRSFDSFEAAIQEKLIVLDIPQDIDLGDKS